MELDGETRHLIASSAAEWFQSAAPVSYFRSHRDSGEAVSPSELWQGVTELGWPGMMVSEANGGSGLPLSAMGIVLDELGRHLSPIPLLSTAVIGVAALTACRPTGLTSKVLSEIAEGKRKVALAVDEGNHHSPHRAKTLAVNNGDSWTLNGKKILVADALGADFFLVSATIDSAESPALFLVNAENATVTPQSLVDGREYGIVEFEQVALDADAGLVAAEDDSPMLGYVLDVARIGIAAEMQGTAWAAFELTLEYLKTREQFGQLIGGFQALQHRAASMYISLELLRGTVDAALDAADKQSANLPELASLAKSLACETLHLVTNETIQLHGGIGMTDEHDAGLYLKRARVLEQLYGSNAFHKKRYAELRGL